MPKETIVRPEPTVIHPAISTGTPAHPPTSGGAEAHHGLSIGWNKLGWVQIHMEPFGAESTGDWHIVDLNRQQINGLIRALRKARDAAYGSDA